MNPAFFGLQEQPFNADARPALPVPHAGHREALAQLVYGVQERKGFMLLTGEVGTGKTTLVQALLRRLDGTTAVAYVPNSLLPFEEILEYALDSLGVAKPAISRPTARGAPALPHRAEPRRPEHGAHPGRGPESPAGDPRADPASLQLRDDVGEGPADPARRSAGVGSAA